jgi:hypothetical protein
MYSFHKIKAAAATLVVGSLLAIAFAATAQASGSPQGLTPQQLNAVRARAEAMDRYYHIGAFSPAAVARRADERRAQASDQFYRLGRYAVIDVSSPFDWGDAGIGAGAALGVAVTLAGGTLVLTRRRHSHSRIA